MMTITNTVIVVNAKAVTENTRYDIEYIIRNGNVSRVNMAIGNQTDENNTDAFIGNITYNDGILTCSLPADSPASDYFEDFYLYLAEVKENGKNYLTK